MLETFATWEQPTKLATFGFSGAAFISDIIIIQTGFTACNNAVREINMTGAARVTLMRY